MKIEQRKISDIRPYDKNPRDNDGAVDAIARSISEYGFRQPIVVDAEGVIVVGHTRWKAAQKLGLQDVPVHVALDLTPAQIKAYRIADNKLAELAEWDMNLLPLELADLRAMDVDLDLLGFADEELEKMLGAGGTDGLTDPDAIPEPPDEAVTRRGDIWVLGNHRLMCGDSMKQEHMAKLMNGELADLLLTDPPYNVAYEGRTEAAMTIANDDMDDDSYRQFLVQSLGSAATALKEGGVFYCWHADSNGLTVRLAFSDIGLKVRQCLVWVKSSLVLGRQDYQWRHEPCLYGWKEGAGHTWLSDRSQTTVLEFDKPVRNGEHPTMKPVKLFAYLVGNSCTPSGLVLDPFGGSGTSLIAAEQAGRKAFLMEIDPRFCDVVIRRWEEFTGKKAQRVEAEVAQ